MAKIGGMFELGEYAHLMKKALESPEVSAPESSTQKAGKKLELEGFKPHVAIIDNFQLPSHDLNGDKIGDISHGSLVGLQIKGRIPGAQLEAFDINDVHLENLYEWRKSHKSTDFPDVSTMTHEEERRLKDSAVVKTTQKIADQIESGIHFDAVNISQAFTDIYGEMNYQGLGDTTGLYITKDNFHKMKPQIRDVISDLYANKDKPWVNARQKNLAEAWPMLEQLERITRSGVPVYIAAGNSPTEANLLGLADGTTLVGYQDKQNKNAPASALNGFTKRFARGEYDAIPLQDLRTGQVVGYDVTGDNKLDVPSKLVSNFGRLFPNPQELPLVKASAPYNPFQTLTGSSLAAPTLLAEDLIQKEIQGAK